MISRSKYLSIFSIFLKSVVCQNVKIYKLTISFEGVYQHLAWSSGKDLVIRLYFKIPKNTRVSFS